MLVRTPSPPPGFKISRHPPQTIEHRPSSSQNAQSFNHRKVFNSLPAQYVFKLTILQFLSIKQKKSDGIAFITGRLTNSDESFSKQCLSSDKSCLNGRRHVLPADVGITDRKNVITVVY